MSGLAMPAKFCSIDRCRSLLAIIVLAASAASLSAPELAVAGAGAVELPQRRLVEIADSIELRQFGAGQFEPTASMILSSPDAKRFAFVVRSGDLRANKVDYAIFVSDYPQAEGKPPSTPRQVFRISSGTNEPGIEHLRWSADGRDMFFSGDDGKKHHRVFRLNVASGKLTPLSPANVDVMSFDITGDGKTLALIVPAPPPPVASAQERQKGIVIGKVDYLQLAGDPKIRPVPPDPGWLLVIRAGRQVSFPLPFPPYYHGAPSLSLSPSGTRVALAGVVTLGAGTAPAHWKRYMRENWPAFPSFWIVDTATGKSRRLLDAPSETYRTIVWTGDHSVLVSSSNLPDGDGDLPDGSPGRFAIEADSDTGAYVKIAEGRFNVDAWDDGRQVATLTKGARAAATIEVRQYRKVDGRWDMLPVAAMRAGLGKPVIAQALNRPPRLAWQDATGRQMPFFDPNPQLRNIELGDAREVEVPLRDGKKIKITAFLPTGWSADKAWPAVLQTHGRDPKSFTMDGNEKTPGFSARALAARGVLVVQLPEHGETYPGTHGTTREPAVGMEIYEDVVDELVRAYGVDRDRVGIVGFSRTGIDTRHALIHSRQRYAASIQADSMLVSYRQYLQLDELGQSLFEGIIGARPVGEGLKTWFENAPGLSAHKMHTPLLVTYFNEWGGAASLDELVPLRLLKKPVEVILFPDGTHNLVKPAERFAMQNIYVDWFRFWLQDYEDPDPAKAAQYERWQKLRVLRDADRASAAKQ